ncbi:MAG TPA: hypothetical protein VG389_25480 [Myxococcota bacterium]|nr:hypothetical protein [Myxococcota bacterium]
MPTATAPPAPVSAPAPTSAPASAPTPAPASAPAPAAASARAPAPKGASAAGGPKTAPFWRLPALVAGVTLAVLSAFSANWLTAGASTDTHFVYQADAWLHGQLHLAVPKPPHDNDWAFKDGRWYVGFPPGPAVAMLPFVALNRALGIRNADGSTRFNDVAFTLVLAALNAALLLLALRLLRARGYSARTEREDLLLVALFAFGTVAFCCSVLGEVWFTAQVMGVTCTLLFFLAALDARHPALAGLALVVGFATRSTVAFAGPFFLLQLLYPAGLPHPGARGAARFLPRLDRAAVVALGRFALPVAAGLALVCWHNWARFGDPGEFGHRWLYGIFHNRKIATYGLLSWAYLPRNLAAALALVPVYVAHFPWVQVSRHGLALWLTTPAFLLLLWPQRRSPLLLPFGLAALCVAVPTLLYQNTGFEQFGFRFSLDFTPWLVLMLAVGAYPLRRLFVALLVWSVLVNAVGAATLKRAGDFYYGNASAKTMFPTD